MLTKERKAEHDFRNLLMEFQSAVLTGDDNLVRFLFTELVEAYRERPSSVAAPRAARNHPGLCRKSTLAQPGLRFRVG